MDVLEQLIKQREGSAMTELLTEAPKLVEPVLPLAEAAPTFSLKGLFGAKPGATASANDPEPVEIEDEYIPLSAEEIEIKAEAKSQMWAAILAMFFDVLNRYIATQSLRPGDRELVKAYDDELRVLGEAPSKYDDDAYHPYHTARERWDDFKEAISESKNTAELDDYQVKMLKRAIKADLEKRNKRKALKGASIYEVLFDIAVAKAGPQGTQFLITKFTNLSDSAR